METTLSHHLLQESASARRTPVDEFRCDVRAALARLSLDGVIALGQEKLARYGFDADRCTSLPEAQAHLVAIFEESNGKRGKIRQAVCRARAFKQDVC